MGTGGGRRWAASAFVVLLPISAQALAQSGAPPAGADPEPSAIVPGVPAPAELEGPKPAGPQQPAPPAENAPAPSRTGQAARRAAEHARRGDVRQTPVPHG